jgi:hypothetical protein
MRQYYARDKKLREENKRKQKEAKRLKKLQSKQQEEPSEQTAVQSEIPTPTGV